MANLFSRVKSAGLDRFGFHVAVTGVSEPAPGFALITFAGAEVGEHEWNPGDRVSVRTPDDQLRNYTPFEWNANAKSARLLGVGRATGPGTRFLNSLTVGSEIQILGPKKSIDLDLQQAPIIVGDETTLGLCAAWAGAHPQLPAHVLLEAADIGGCEAAANAISVSVERIVGDRDGLVGAVIDCVRADEAASLIVSGRAQTIAAVRKALKAAGLSGRPTKAKAYWDENRAGLD